MSEGSREGSGDGRMDGHTDGRMDDQLRRVEVEGRESRRLVIARTGFLCQICERNHRTTDCPYRGGGMSSFQGGLGR